MTRRLLAAVAASTAALAACGGDGPGRAPQAPPSAVEPRGGDPRLDQALIAAAARGHTTRVRHLLERGADARARDSHGRTALVAAAYGNHLAAARALVRAGADVNAKDDTEQSAYLIATSEVGDDPRLLELTLDHGAEVDAKDSYNGTGLIRAAERGHHRIVRRLLAAGIDRDHVNRLGWTALHEAIVLGDGGAAHIQTVRALVDGGVDVNVRGAGGRPLAQAEQRGFDTIAQILRDAGAHP